MQLLLAKNQVNKTSLAAILRGQTQAEATGFKHLAPEEQNARSMFYFEISVPNLCFNSDGDSSKISDVHMYHLNDFHVYYSETH